MTAKNFGSMLARGTVCAVMCAGVFAAAGTLGGCQSKKDKAAESTKAAVSTFQSELNKMPELIQSTSDWMVKATSGQNPKRADDFREFQKSLTKMRDRASLVAREEALAVADSDKYFRAWVKEANRTKPADRAAIDETIAASKAKRDISLGYFENARKSFTNLAATMTSIEGRMAKDMSEAGVMALQQDVSRAVTDAMNTRDYIDRLDDQINAALAAK